MMGIFERKGNHILPFGVYIVGGSDNDRKSVLSPYEFVAGR